MLRNTKEFSLTRRIAPVVALLVGMIVPPAYAQSRTPTLRPSFDPRTSPRLGTDSGTGQSDKTGSLTPGNT
jgi:hypothetical protein